MHQVELSYAIRTARNAAATIRNPLVELLAAVRAHGSISAAAKGLGFSYRHVWGELKRWEDSLERTLIIWEKGQPARLSEFGEKLLWAERQVQARLAPQIEALHADLERAFAVAFDDTAHVVSFYASHDDAMVALRQLAVDQSHLHLDIRFTGSVDAISALNEGRCVMAGFHALPDSPPGSRFGRAYKPLLEPGRHKVIGFARRQQGLVVAPGNPLNIRTVPDLARPGLRFVNRSLGAGTRVLLDELLDGAGLSASRIAGYERTEPSHAAVAHAVASGTADVGLLVESAAVAAGLGFVPLTMENYFLVCLVSALELPGTQALLGLLRSKAWHERLAAMPGYTPSRSGEILSMSKVLPWWQFPSKPRKAGSPR